MKKIWKKIHEIWWEFWEDDVGDDTKTHLSQTDKRSLWYGGFLLSMITIAACLFITGINSIRINRENGEDVEEVMNMVAFYLATATDDEYNEIAKEIRHDLVYSEYGKDIETAIQYIPNTTENCCLERQSYPARLYLACPNTGELYGLDIFEAGDRPEEYEKQNSTKMTFGYDEISGTRINIMKSPSQKTGTATIYRERRIVSVHKMKSHFCDDCIREIIETVKGSLVEEIVICDIKEKRFYPVEEGEVQIGDYNLQIANENGDYTIEIKYNPN